MHAQIEKQKINTQLAVCCMQHQPLRRQLKQKKSKRFGSHEFLWGDKTKTSFLNLVKLLTARRTKKRVRWFSCTRLLVVEHGSSSQAAISCEWKKTRVSNNVVLKNLQKHATFLQTYIYIAMYTL